MQTSESLDKLAPALVKAQAEIKPAVKDSTNPHFKSKYADLSAVWDAVHAILAANGLALIQLPVHAEDQRVHLTTRLLHTSGQWLEETASIPIVKHDPHGYGSGLTYLRRYGASALLFLATEDDDANGATQRPITATQHAKDEMDALPPDEQGYIQKLAVRIIATHEGGGDVAAAYLAAKNDLDHERQLALWSLIPSKTRTAIKKPTSAELATQA